MYCTSLKLIKFLLHSWTEIKQPKNKCREFIRFWIHVHVENVRVCKYVYVSHYDQYLIILWECFNSLIFFHKVWLYFFLYYQDNSWPWNSSNQKYLFKSWLDIKEYWVIKYMYLLFLHSRSKSTSQRNLKHYCKVFKNDNLFSFSNTCLKIW